MADLIDRAAANAALEKLDELMRHRAETEDKEFVKIQAGITLARCEIDAIPTIDAVPVVRCRECRYMVGAFTNNKIECANGYKHMGPDSFCSCSARMDAPERVGDGQDE